MWYVYLGIRRLRDGGERGVRWGESAPPLDGHEPNQPTGMDGLVYRRDRGMTGQPALVSLV